MPEITTKLVETEDIDSELHNEFQVEETATTSTESTSYVRIDEMILNVTPPIESDGFVFFSGSFRQAGELIGYANMFIALFVNGVLEKEIEISPYAWIEYDGDGGADWVWVTAVNGTIFWGLQEMTPETHTIEVKYRVPYVLSSDTELVCGRRKLNTVLFYR